MDDKKELAARMRLLVDQVQEANRLYYDEANPTLTDEEYDALLAELTALERAHPELIQPDSPNRKLAVNLAAGLEKVRHQTPMMSIANTFSFDGLTAWTAEMSRLFQPGELAEYAVEHKYDGLAISLLYRDGKLVRGATRGDHEVGENVTESVRQVAGIPQRIEYLGELDVRGEVLMTKAAFEALNQKRMAAGEPLAVNPRNAASGTLRLQDPTEVGRRGLQFYAYSISAATLPETLTTQAGVLGWLATLGFSCDSPVICDGDPVAMQEAYARISATRASLPYDIDGVVFKLNNLSKQAAAGFTARTPKGMLAYKFNQQEAETVLEAITIQVGRTGVLTPVAELRPVNLGGVLVSRATLHNEENIARLDVRIGDTVLVRRNGDVIPGVLGVKLANRPESSVKYQFPAACPCCGGTVQRVPGEAAVRCVAGELCSDQRLYRLVHFASRPALAITGLGEGKLRILLDAGLLTGLLDLYTLTPKQLAGLPGIGERGAQALVDAIQASRSQPFNRLLVALGIPGVGVETAKAIAARFSGLPALRKATREELLGIESLGETTAAELLSFLGAAERKVFLDWAEAVWPDRAASGSVLTTGSSSLVFVITGTLPGVAREEAQAQLEAAGATVSGNLSGKTSYLVAGDAAGSKLEKARRLGVPVVDWATAKQLASIN